MHKDIFTDGHKQSDIVEDCKNFLKKIKELKPYMIEFEEDSLIKPKIYLFNRVIRGDNW